MHLLLEYDSKVFIFLFLQRSVPMLQEDFVLSVSKFTTVERPSRFTPPPPPTRKQIH